MAINHPEVQIATAIQPLDAIPTRKGTTFRASIYDTYNTRREVFLKLLKLEDIAKEVLCAVLARMLGLPIKQAFYVQVDPAIVPGRRAGNRLNLGFGLEREYYPAFRIANDQINDEIRRWPEALACGVFDEWIFNDDRLPNNLLFAENRVYWMIDHDEALPNSAQPADICYSQILHVLSDGKTEFELHKIRREALVVVEQLKSINWDEVLEFVCPADVATTGIGSHFEKYMSFLRQRIERMPDILTQSLGIKQLNMKLDNHINLADRDEKKS
ncbi:MAG: HipA family kinase [Pseudohongiella sp.]|uniref:HipA family kinase n=1 Tax=Pseudohongiella sp. TaxID=1979412 RepID=UPI0034A08A15